MIPAQIGKIHDIRFGHSMSGSSERLADAQLLKILAKRMDSSLRLLPSRLIHLTDGANHGRVPLDGRTLEVVLNTP